MAGWTEQQIETLKRLCAQGLAFSIIAERMGMSRNAVLGKASRLKLTKSPAPSRPSGTRRTVTAQGKRILTPPHKAAAGFKAIQEADQEAEKQIAPGDPLPLMIPLLDLEPNMCRWPFGEVGDNGFGFCGHEKAHGSSYCEFHDDVSHFGYPKQKIARAA